MTQTHTNTTVVIALCLVLVGPIGAVSFTGVAAGGPSIYAVDTDHGLDSADAVKTYETEGVVTGGVAHLDMTVTVADKAEDVGLSEWATSSSGRTFVRLDYREDLERTIRIKFPADYFRPRLKASLADMNDTTTASVEPSNGRNYTSMEVHFEESSSVVFALPTSRGVVAGIRSEAKSVWEESTGIELPSFGSGGAEWKMVDSTAFEGNQTTRAIQHDDTLNIQYDAAADSYEKERWVKVRKCSETDASVCRFKRDGQANTTYLLSTTDDPPPIRYREGGGVFAGIGSAWNDAKHGVESSVESLSGWLNGGEGASDDEGSTTTPTPGGA